MTVAIVTPHGTETSLRVLASGEREDPQLELAGRRAVWSPVGAAGDEQSSPSVALVLGRTGPYGYAEFAGELLRERSGAVKAFLRPSVQRVHVDPLDQLGCDRGRQRRGPQIALEPPAEGDEQADRVQREHRGQLPPLAAHRRHDEQRHRPFHAGDRFELLARQREPGGGGDPPAAELVRVELVGMREHPPREVICLRVRQTEADGERAALRRDITEHGRVRQVDRELGVRSAKPVVEAARGRGDAGPVKAGVGVGVRLPVGERLDRGERQMAGVERDPVSAQYRLRVIIRGAPGVAVVRVDGLILGQADQRPPAQVLERSAPAREAALQLARGVGAARLGDEAVSLRVFGGGAFAPAGQAQCPPRAGDGGRRCGGLEVIGH